MATGWLGWSPRDAMETPIPMILLALDAKVQWVRMSNGVGEPEDPGAKVKRVLRAFGK